MPKTVAIVQSSYIPWKGFFDMINLSDEFILFDDVQYTRRDWRNRNKIKTKSGLQWLTIPVQVKDRFEQKIKDTLISDEQWGWSHWETIRHTYSKARYFDHFADAIGDVYQHLSSFQKAGDFENSVASPQLENSRPSDIGDGIDISNDQSIALNNSHLSYINACLIRGICKCLNIGTNITFSMDYDVVDGKSERLLSLCKQANATTYISGPSAACYLDENLFKENGVDVIYMDYSDYPEYRQMHEPFEHGVSILDLMFNEGPNTHLYMKSFGKNADG